MQLSTRAKGPSSNRNITALIFSLAKHKILSVCRHGSEIKAKGIGAEISYSKTILFTVSYESLGLSTDKARTGKELDLHSWKKCFVAP